MAEKNYFRVYQMGMIGSFINGEPDFLSNAIPRYIF